jgi:hypothetical protein
MQYTSSSMPQVTVRAGFEGEAGQAMRCAEHQMELFSFCL